MTGPRPQRPTVLALDLEGTLISNAMSQIPRPGLKAFLTRCETLFERVVAFTTVREPLFRQIAQLLVEEGVAPNWFACIEYVNWRGPTKDLAFIPGIQAQQALLLDDYEAYVHPGQEGQWLWVAQFEPPYSERDRGLARALELLQQRLA
ncbi:NIF family HAD-type phosphatase [Variovorax ureilyticus]|uniref:NIF family HAD-type phosphatase n=1 Tax=Variovorax ureilyticus TaxID=1836198 RepID=A0ABU8VR38_9BURK